MHDSPWVDVFRGIPAEHHDQLSLVTQGGAELIVQFVLKMNEECIAFKGRMSGSQESGRLFFVPYSQIDYLCTMRPIGDEEFAAWFGKTDESANSKDGTNKTDSKKQGDGKASGSGLHQLSTRQAALLDRVRSRASSDSSAEIRTKSEAGEPQGTSSGR